MLTEAGGIGAEQGCVPVGTTAEMQRLVGEECELGVKVIKLMGSGDGIVPSSPRTIPSSPTRWSPPP